MSPLPEQNEVDMKGPALTRRDILRYGAATLAVPTIIPAIARGAEGVAPSERLSVALVGMGKMMWGHIGYFLNRQDVQVTAICDVETIRLDKCAKRINDHYSEKIGKDYKGLKVYRDFREVCQRPDIDAVFIASTTNWHAIHSIEAMKNGKDVYCEKPLALTVREAEAIREAAHRYNRIFQTGSQQRSDYKFRFACELVRNGAIGKVQRIHVNVGGPPGPCYLPPQPTPETLNWDMWVGPAPMRPYHSELCPLDDYKVFPHWRAYRDFGGGGMTDWGAHHFDIAQWGMGMDGHGPVEVLPPKDGLDGRLTYKYESGIVMTHGGARGKAGVDFIGENGSVGVNRGFLTTDPEDLMKLKWGPNDIRLYESRDHKGNWLDGIKTRRQCICTADIGCSSITVCHLGYWLNRPLKWDPKKSQFVNDPAADRLLSRAMRAPWTLTV
jgi:predicted dehydrogenase